MRQKPTIGRIVIVKGVNHNGTDEHPAIITRVWSLGTGVDGADMINASVFEDAQTCVTPATSLYLFESKEHADGYLGKCDPEYKPVVAFWPPRA